jgi:SAM-dependent methyltransferase
VAADRIHLGCGTDVLPGWVNVDSARIPGVDVVHDLTSFPWPFESNRFREVRMVHVLEHLPDTIRTLEEIHRICAPSAEVTIHVPYWNSRDMMTDPTHKRSFSEYSFDYFDPDKRYCRERPYYSCARFHVEISSYFVKLGCYRRVSAPWARAVLEIGARHLCGVIWAMEVCLRALKDGGTQWPSERSRETLPS